MNTPTTTLDVHTLPSHTVYDGKYGALDMESFLLSFRPVVDELERGANVRASFGLGFAMAKPAYGTCEVRDWDDPSQLTWFVGGWGSDREVLIANAVRKMRAVARTYRSSTLTMASVAPGEFLNPVLRANDDGTFPWGDFPFGGALRVRYGSIEVMGGVSGFSQHEDHMLAHLVLSSFAARMFDVDHKDTDD